MEEQHSFSLSLAASAGVRVDGIAVSGFCLYGATHVRLAGSRTWSLFLRNVSNDTVAVRAACLTAGSA